MADPHDYCVDDSRTGDGQYQKKEAAREIPERLRARAFWPSSENINDPEG